MSQVQVVTARAGQRPGPFATSGEALRRLERIHGPGARHWVYEDAVRDVIAMVVRWDTDRGPVRRTIRRCPGGGWALGGMPRPWPLYGLPEVLENAGGTIYVTGSEEAADAALRQGLLGITSAEGSAGVGKTDWQPLAGRDVVILPDNDPTGRWYAQMAATVLSALRPPARVRTVRLPDLPPHGDIRAWLVALGPDATAAAVRERMESLVAAAPAPPPAPAGDSPILRCLAQVAPSPVRWLWPGRVPLGRLTLLVGRPGAGKSFLTADLAARVSTGRPWPDGTACAAGAVLLICAEDDPADTLRPRLAAHGAALQRVHVLSRVRRSGADGRPCETAFTLADIGSLEESLRACPDCRLVIVDPIGSFLGRGTDAYRENHVRALLEPVARLAEAYGPAVLVTAHQRKSAASRHADDLALGSRAFTGVARAVWHLIRDPQDPQRRLLLPGKNNLAAQGSGLAFRIHGVPPALRWETAAVDLTANEALVAERPGHSGGDSPARRAAMDWLRQLLATGVEAVAEVRREAVNAGFSWRTVQRAKDELALRSVRPEPSGPWLWKLPNA
ncbi:MAG: AAA family ATPase [Planctomycetes bacterium]|nr:AAA family ATPase [Planctomycetota bacterium]